MGLPSALGPPNGAPWMEIYDVKLEQSAQETKVNFHQRTKTFANNIHRRPPLGEAAL